MARKTISTKARLSLFQKRGGVCYLCGGKVQVGESWELEHRIPIAMGGEDEEANWEVAHIKCHRSKTTEDVGNIAKAKRREARHYGAKVSRSPMAFGKKSKWKKKLDGTVVLRDK